MPKLPHLHANALKQYDPSTRGIRFTPTNTPALDPNPHPIYFLFTRERRMIQRMKNSDGSSCNNTREVTEA
jgi:hypothetical protein